jgi:hypothetical protein
VSVVHAVHRVENDKVQDMFDKHNSKTADEVRVAAGVLQAHMNCAVHVGYTQVVIACKFVREVAHYFMSFGCHPVSVHIVASRGSLVFPFFACRLKNYHLVNSSSTSQYMCILCIDMRDPICLRPIHSL